MFFFNNQEKILKITTEEWKKLKSLLDDFGILVAELHSGDMVSPYSTNIPSFGSPPSDATAFRFNRNEPARGIVFIPKLRRKTPHMELVLDIVHEAAHLILNDIENDEDRGIAQVELGLALNVSIKVFKSLVHFHNSVYEWNMDYLECVRSKSWKLGFQRAKKRCFLNYPWDEHSEHLKLIERVVQKGP